MRRTLATDDDGFTLVELIVYGLLLIVVLSVVAGLFVSLYSTQKSVDAISNATSDGQSADDSIQAGIRNSTGFVVLGSTNGGDQLLVARTLGSGATATTRCVGWFYSAADRTIRTTQLTAPVAGMPGASTVATWTLLASGVSPVPGGAVFSPALGASSTLNLNFSSAAGKGSPVQFSSSVASRSGGSVLTGCY